MMLDLTVFKYYLKYIRDYMMSLANLLVPVTGTSLKTYLLSWTFIFSFWQKLKILQKSHRRFFNEVRRSETTARKCNSLNRLCSWQKSNYFSGRKFYLLWETSWFKDRKINPTGITLKLAETVLQNYIFNFNLKTYRQKEVLQ